MPFNYPLYDTWLGCSGPFRQDARTIRNYTLGIGDDNPLFIDPEYGKGTRYGSQIAPGPVLSQIRGITAHGAQEGKAGMERPQGYPVANFFSGTAWEFFDVVRVGSRFRSSMVTKEMIEKPGSRGNLIFFISELFFWDDHGDLPGKCSGTLIMVPIETMGSSRTMPVERLGEKLLYERKASQYSREDIEGILKDIESNKRRGAFTDPRHNRPRGARR